MCRFAGRHDGGRPRDEASIEVVTPDRLFSPLESRIFDSVAQHGTCQERGEAGNSGFQGVGRISPENAGKRKKIELCAARLFGARGPDGCPLGHSIKVNLEYETVSN